MTGAMAIQFEPLLPWPILLVLAVLAALVVGLSIHRGLSGWPLRALAALILLLTLAGPVWQREDRAMLDDIALLLVDRSASQTLSDRQALTDAAASDLERKLERLGNIEVRRIDVTNGSENSTDDTGTRMMSALQQALAEAPLSRISGIFMVSDGIVHDMDRAPALPAPTHLLLTGHKGDWDRRLIVENAPAYAILGEEFNLTLKIEDQGQVPEGLDQTQLEISVDGGEPMTFTVPVGEEIELPVALPHGGRNVIQFSVSEAEGELTDRNNTALVQINGVRDRLRVLLVSGEPHPGGRTWRNLLKSDSSVDLVHFTILRPPEKQDGVPVGELSLIAFPTRELFVEKVNDFDLIIFDRYKRRGLLPSVYMDNVRNYVETGGAVLISAGPDFAAAESLYRTPLSEILPASPTARVIEQGYLPKVTDLGERHPVTAALSPPEGQDDWGRWMRQVEVTPESGQTVMTGSDDKPLLILDRVGEGRVALLASDQAWLWGRGFEGGGPQLELLRRLAHWMMKEPELEEEALWGEPNGQSLRIIRRSLADEVPPVILTDPSGNTVEIELEETAPGRFEALHEGSEIGLYRMANGDLETVIGLGPQAPQEFVETIATEAKLDPLIETVRGGSAWIEDGLPSLRSVRAERPAAGRGWLGITPRGAFEVEGLSKLSLLPPWLTLILAALAIIGAWLLEGRRS